MAKFAYGEIVRVKDDAPHPLRSGQKAWIILVMLPHDRTGAYFDQFAAGTIYSVEYEDGEAADVHENFLESLQRSN
jgi:hypothetical protein